MTDDLQKPEVSLVKRLRESGTRSEVELHEDREEAADCIEALTAENARLARVVEDISDEADLAEQEACMLENDFIKAEKEIEALKAALRTLLSTAHADDHAGWCDALKETTAAPPSPRRKPMADDDLIRRGDALNAVLTADFRHEAHDAIADLPTPAPAVEVQNEAYAQRDLMIRANGLLEREIEKLTALLMEARQDLEVYITNEYPKEQHPYYERQWNRDMELCRRIDAALAEIEGEKK